MNKINFSYNYIKLKEQTTATLIKVEDFILNKDTREQYKEFLEKDTAIVGGGRYHLNNGKYIIMTFLGNKGIEFTTIRAASPYYYGKLFDRKKWALDKIGEQFEIKIGELNK